MVPRGEKVVNTRLDLKNDEELRRVLETRNAAIATELHDLQQQYEDNAQRIAELQEWRWSLAPTLKAAGIVRSLVPADGRGVGDAP